MLEFRTLTADDQEKPWHWLHVALWDPPPAGLRPVEVLQAPEARIYAEGWGRPSDVGVPEFQHKGHGRPLMLETLAAASLAGYRQVSLTVHPENPALHLYESCGFRKAGRRNNYHLMVASVG